MMDLREARSTVALEASTAACIASSCTKNIRNVSASSDMLGVPTSTAASPTCLGDLDIAGSRSQNLDGMYGTRYSRVHEAGR